MIWVALIVCGSLLAGLSLYLGVKWPVSRAAYDDIVRIADSEREHNRKLTRIILRLKVRQEAHLPQKGEVRREREQDKIDVAISRSKHAKNPAIRTALSNFADAEKLRGVSIDDIIKRLDSWDHVGDDLRDIDPDDDDTLLS